ncbi:hypothetical protein KSB_66200 [Ktedonobacter robiniae]|uniref:Uncharacterized protein n=1 Tax=Ktedonobacter robiniae TaxID=2778365 RepID=A0ABQ3V0J2_9CHLR|nr:hypothetical protein KSB_66200 [Ktedonobacter robiniae]
MNSVVHLVRPVSAGAWVVWELESNWEGKEDSCHRREKEEE